MSRQLWDESNDRFVSTEVSSSASFLFDFSFWSNDRQPLPYLDICRSQQEVCLSVEKTSDFSQQQIFLPDECKFSPSIILHALQSKSFLFSNTLSFFPNIYIFFDQYFEIEKFFFWMSNRIFSFSKCICTLLYVSRYRIINAFDSRKKASRALRWVRSILLRLSHDSTSLYGHRINCRLTLFNNHTFAPSFPRLVSNYSYRALRPFVLFTFESESNDRWNNPRNLILNMLFLSRIDSYHSPRNFISTRIILFITFREERINRFDEVC